MPDSHSETLAAYVTKVMKEKGLSSYAVERNSNKGITQSYTNRIKNGEVLTPSAPKLKALALGLGVSEEELFAVVRGKSPDSQTVVSERLARLISTFEKLPKSHEPYARSLIDLLEREFDRLSKE